MFSGFHSGIEKTAPIITRIPVICNIFRLNDMYFLNERVTLCPAGIKKLMPVIQAGSTSFAELRFCSRSSGSRVYCKTENHAVAFHPSVTFLFYESEKEITPTGCIVNNTPRGN